MAPSGRTRIPPAAAALLGAGEVTLISEEMPATGQQKAAKLASALVHGAQEVLFQKAREKRLRQILRVLGGVPLPADERVERIPIGRAQAGQRILHARRVAGAAGQEHNAPLRGREALGA